MSELIFKVLNQAFDGSKTQAIHRASFCAAPSWGADIVGTEVAR